jgi:hypothetical protein
LAVLLGVFASLAWSQPDRHIWFTEGNLCVFPQWVDAFVHSGIVATFAESKGCFDLQNAWMAGTRVFFYHYAGFIPSSALVGLTHFMPIEIYSRFYLPGSYLMVSLSAYALARQWWNAEAALVAACFLMLVPDGSWHGLIGDFGYGFYWLLHSSPSLGYGMGLLTLAWIIMISACRIGFFPGVLCSYACFGLLIAYKAQLFVGGLFLIWFVPIFFFKGISQRVRSIAILASVILAGGIIFVAEHVGNVPHININGGGERAIIATAKATLISHLLPIWALEIPLLGYILTAFYLFLAILGYWGVLWLYLLTIKPNPDDDKLKRIFPILVFLNFIIINLVLDPTDDILSTEFTHRPFVWAYFVVVVCVSAGLYSKLVSSAEGLALAKVKVAVIFGIGLSLGFPLLLNQRVIDPLHFVVDSFIPADQGLIACGQFLAQQSQRGDVIQATDSDPNFILTCISARREWVTAIYYHSYAQGSLKHQNLAYAKRLDQIAEWNSMNNEIQIMDFAKERRIRWVILDPTTSLHWPHEILDKTVFASNGYRVIQIF